MPQSNSINIANLDRAEVVYALYIKAGPQNKDTIDKQKAINQIQEELDNSRVFPGPYFDYVDFGAGEVSLKLGINNQSGEIMVREYNKLYGAGAAEEVIDAVYDEHQAQHQAAP